ncbi:MAG TPA: DUF551 domain-containing protein, partial [Sphingomicrobium sp.]|nr:DUF551 domain-containing protein [Sphingomicrobium sp.]
ESSDQALARDYAELRDTYDRVVVERDEWKERAGFLWTAPDVDMWGKVAESKGVHIREKVNGLLRRAVRAEGQNEALAQVLLDVRAAIVEHAPDTLWVSLIETAVDCIDAVLAATAPAEARAAYPAWRRIEALPDEMRDGREVILRRGDRVGGACWCTWPDTEIAEGGEGWSVGCDGSSWDDEKSPTHWMPLPDPAEACPLTNPRGSK